MKLFNAILTVPMALCLSFSAMAETKELATFDVIDLEFFVKNPKAKNSSQKEIEVGSIKMNAEMSNNRIKTFNVQVNTRYGSLYEYSASLNELRGKTIPLKSHGVSLGQLQGVNMNADGEGTIKFSPPASLLGANMPKSIELGIKRVGAQRKWAVFYNSQVLRSAKVELSKNPIEMSTWALFASPPKLTSLKTEVLGCDDISVTSVLVNYEAPELLKTSKCNFATAKPVLVNQIVSTLASHLNVFERFYKDGISPTESQNKMLWSIEALKAYGLKIQQKHLLVKNEEYDYDVDLFSNLVEAGQEELIKILMAQGLYPTTRSALEEAVMNLYQVNPKTKQITESAQGRRILALIKPTIQEKGIAADVLLSLTGYQGSKSLTLTSFDYETNEMLNTNFEFTQKLLAAMVAEDFDMQTGESSWGGSVTKVILGSAESEGYPFLSKSQARILAEQARQAGAK